MRKGAVFFRPHIDMHVDLAARLGYYKYMEGRTPLRPFIVRGHDGAWPSTF